MKTNEQRKVNPEMILGAVLTLPAPTWPLERGQKDKVTSAYALREPQFSDGDLLHGDGP